MARTSGSAAAPPSAATSSPPGSTTTYLHLVQVPIVLGRGVRIWDGLEALEDAYDVEAVSSQRRHHLTFTLKAV